MKRHFLYIACMFICSVAFAQSSEKVDEGLSIYAGARVGMPVGVGSFSGFNADFPGWDAGVFAGYRFNNMMSVELDVAVGHIDMLSRDFCRDVFWNEAEGMKYRQLKNKTFIHRYSAKFNVNILSFFAATENTPWRAEVSPLVSLLGRSGKLVRLADASQTISTGKGFNFGYGCNIGASYLFADKYQAGVYAAYSQYTGSAIDCLPKGKGNFIVEAGVRFTYNMTLGRRGGKSVSSSVSGIDVVLPETPSSEDSVLVDVPETVVLTLDQRRSNALEGLAKYPDAVLADVASFMDSLMTSAATYSDLCEKMTWIGDEVLPEIRRYESVSGQVSKADSLTFILSRIAEADAMLDQPMKKDAVRAMSAELATLNTDTQFISDKIESTRTLLNRYYLTTTWTMDIIERLEGAKGADDSALQVSDVFKEYEGNGRLEMIREIPFMNEIVSRLISCFPYSESGYDVQSADWTKITEIKTVIANSRK